MVEGLISKKEKPSNTEVLGLLMDPDKLKFITKLNGTNLKGLCKLSYKIKRLNGIDSITAHNEVIEDYLTLKCAMESQKGNRSDQIVDALKHIIEDQNKDDIKNLAQQIKS